jgi:hypothetical protein
MKYRFEKMPNKSCVVLHVTSRLAESKWVSDTSPGTAEENELRSVLEGTLGVTEIKLEPYEITAFKGAAFTFEEVAHALLEQLKMWLVLKGEDVEHLEQLPTLRTDILCMKCPECQRIEDEEMARAIKDLENL